MRTIVLHSRYYNAAGEAAPLGKRRKIMLCVPLEGNPRLELGLGLAEAEALHANQREMFTLIANENSEFAVE